MALLSSSITHRVWAHPSLAISVGAIISTILSIWQEKVAMRFGKLSTTPEGRLYFSCIESALMPIGLFW